METQKVTDELQPPSWWRKWYRKRIEKIKNLKVTMKRRGRWRNVLEIRIHGDKDFLDEFRLYPHIMGDAVDLVLSNMIVKSATFHYEDRVNPFKYPPGQTTLKVVAEDVYECGAKVGEPPYPECCTVLSGAVCLKELKTKG